MIPVLLTLAASVSQPAFTLPQSNTNTPYHRTMAFLAQIAVGKAKSDNDEAKVCYLGGVAYSPGYTYKWCSGINDPVTGCHGYSCITCKENGSWTPRQAC